jgi:hypothetical protein
MKASTLAAKRTIQNQIDVRAKARLIAEWEHNRFSPIQSVTVTPQQVSLDPEWQTFYELESVTLPNRPRTGSAKARTGSSKIKPVMAVRDLPQDSRFYPSSATDVYKYWSSTQLSTGTRGSDGGFPIPEAPITVTTLYKEGVVANKIVVGFETSYAAPRTWSIQVSSDGNNWNTVANNSILGSDGIVSLWRNESSAWTDVADYTNPVLVKGIRINVYSMTEAFSHVDLLQMGMRLENDLTDLLIDYDKAFEVSSRSFVAPLGQASSNSATVTLSNFDLRFNNNNSSSLYKGLIDKNVKFKMDLLVDATRQGGAAEEPLREFTMWVDNWGGQDEDSVSVSLKDSSVFLQEEIVPKVFFEEYTIGAVIWQMLDLTGHLNYKYSKIAAENGQVIPYYWPDQDRTIWEEIASLAEATQTAVYFDEYDILQIVTRQTMFRANRPVDWNFDAIQNGQKFPDIVDYEVDYDLEANKVDIVYSPAAYSDFNNGFPKMETVWEPEEDTVVLRSTALVKDLAANSTDLWIRQSDAIVWPYESLLNIRGEILKYSGKEYVYYKKGGGTNTVVVKSKEEKDGYDTGTDSDEYWAWKNYFTGRLIVAERGMMGTAQTSHPIRSGNYTSVVTNYDNTVFRPTNNGYTYKEGYIQARSDSSDVHTYTLTKSDTSVLALKSVMYGTKMRFPNDGWNVGGLWFAGDWGDAGYYLEISTTEHIDALENRTWRHELSLQSMPGDRPHQPVRSNNGEEYKGFGWSLFSKQWFTVDVKWTYIDNGSVQITAFVNGVWAAEWFVGTGLNGDINPPPNEGRFGVFVRGNCVVDYEYLYAIGYDIQDDPFDADSTSFLDLVSGGFTSGYIQRDWRYDFQFISPWYSGNYFPQSINRAKYVFDEFGAQVHEMRSFEVQFKDDKVPVDYSYPYLSNTSQIACVAYESNAFGAKILLANAHRDNAIVKGEDKLTFGEDNPVDHTFFVYGRCLYQEDERTVTKTDDQGIRRRGVSQTQFNSRYIQTQKAADDLADWVVKLWGSGVEEVTMNVFGNPLVQLGDLVTINYPVKGVSPATHKYFIVKISNTYDGGLTTNLTLRRAKL